ncbi:hypothetical protein SAMN04488107_2327 [Geodermatophilus saharensis]|uniref:DUF1453 domain-containing protein n=1 Tax=Geodermatophilus saharensis TaxID=1137994 RepID=A0A239E353_9ACTN|nr:hypothetical protein [Geodermatophilus saharensis]SNS38402.1 hypothetical protein SAMN04488107_2327 [Geodermatophilus saharensis]
MSAAATVGTTALASSGAPAENGVVEVVALTVLLALAGWSFWRRRALRRRYHLGHRERAVRLQQQWLEPVVAVVVVAGVLAKDVAAGSAHLVALAVGGVVGAVLGVLRGRYLLGRARRVGNRLVLERTWQEVLLLVVLVVLQMVQRELSTESTSALALVSTALLSAGVVESVARVTYLTVRARTATTQDPPGSAAGLGRTT